MGYQGRVPKSPPDPITRIPRRAADLVDESARIMVHDGIDYMLEQVKINTPVSEPPPVEGFEHIPGGDGIHLREEIHREDVAEVSSHVHEAKVGSNKPYAPYVEEGTGLWGPKHAKYLIVPHNPSGMLRWPGRDGKWHYAKLVWHPGSPGDHMFLIGGEMTERSPEIWTRRGNEYLQEGMR